jgi:hypothetical protein
MGLELLIWAVEEVFRGMLDYAAYELRNFDTGTE